MKVTRYQNKDSWGDNAKNFEASLMHIPSTNELHLIFAVGGKKRGVEYRVRITDADLDALTEAMLEMHPTKACDAFNKALKKQLRKSRAK